MKEEAKEKLIADEGESDEEEVVNIKPETNNVSYFGVSLIVCSAFFYSISSLIVKLMVKVDPMELLLFRYFGLFMYTLPIVIFYDQTLFPRDLKQNMFLCIHSAAGVAGGAFSFYAFRHLPLGDASALCFSTPLFVALLSILFMIERCSTFTWFVVCMTFTGVVLISKPESLFGLPTDHPVEIWGVLSATFAAFCKANSFISLRFCNTLHFSVVICHFGLVGLVCMTVYAFLTSQFCIPSDFLARTALVAMSLLGFLGQMMLTIASQWEKPATMSVCRSADILFAFLYQIFIFHHMPDMYSIFGTVLIVASVFFTKMKPHHK